MRHFQFFIGFIFGLFVLVACASVQYKYYGLRLSDSCYQEGLLLGKEKNKDWPDVPFEQCKGDSTQVGKCVIQFREDFFKKDEALKQCEAALKQCQKSKP